MTINAITIINRLHLPVDIQYQYMKRLILTFLLALPICCITAQTYEDFVNKAMDYIEQENYDYAEQSLLGALRLEPANPGNTLLLVNLGTVQRSLGKYAEALVSYNAAIAQFPSEPLLLHNRAALYCEMDSLNDAMADYNTIVLLNPKDEEALYRRALLHINDKEYQKANADLEKILEMNPENVKASSYIGSIMKRQGKWAEAEELYTGLIYKNKTNADLYFNRAECYLQLNKLAKTQQDITKAMEYGYSDAAIYVLRGQLRLSQYDKGMAKDDFLMAQELGANKELIEGYLKLCK